MGDSNRRRVLCKLREQNNLCIYCGKIPPSDGTKGCKPCRQRKYAVTARFAKNHPETAKNYREMVRREVLAKYGGRCNCKGCPYPDVTFEFMVIDHIDSDGGIERRRLYGSQNGSSFSWYMKLRREPIRHDLQVLCHNCNMAKSMYGGVCPHELRMHIPEFMAVLEQDAQFSVVTSVSPETTSASV